MTDRQTDRPTDTASYRVARARLKRPFLKTRPDTQIGIDAGVEQGQQCEGQGQWGPGGAVHEFGKNGLRRDEILSQCSETKS